MKKLFTIIVYIFAIIGFTLVAVYTAVELGFTKTSGIIDAQHDYFKDATSSNQTWAQGDEWNTLKLAVAKDELAINGVASTTNVSSRLIVSILIVEQLRLFYSNREIFKSVFSPLKILGNQSQFSWGVMGIKQDTARQVEDNLKNISSPWYLESLYEHALDYPATTTDIDAARFARLTDEHNRYYSYLYGALIIKELEAQWQKSGISITDRPEILATLFNIGFQNSHPHADPQSGGAAITLGNTTYSFGGLAGQFYYSNELIDVFPR